MSILFLFTAKAQEAALQNSINLNFQGWGYEDRQLNGIFLVAHEWKPLQFVGVETGIGYGWFRDYDLTEYSIDLGVKQRDLRETNGDFWLLQGKLTGYLPLWRDDDYILHFQAFVSLLGGFASEMNMNGKLEIYELEQVLTVSGNYKSHFYSGFELGVWFALGDNFGMKFYLGSNSIKLEKALKDMNTQVGDFPQKFHTYVPDVYAGFSLFFAYPRKSEKN